LITLLVEATFSVDRLNGQTLGKPMAAKIVNIADPDEGETLCATVEEARATLAAMVESFKLQGYKVDEQHSPDEDYLYPQYAVYDYSDGWIGTYTILPQ
jgi:hypothetical protein